tara:strand:+ start:221 stop:478 length:258 start_codon:yes stop_codon:yes gene_type:complete
MKDKLNRNVKTYEEGAPPIGVLPKEFWLMKVIPTSAWKSRLADLERAIKEYSESNYPISEDWIKERNELILRLSSKNINLWKIKK